MKNYPKFYSSSNTVLVFKVLEIFDFVSLITLFSSWLIFSITFCDSCLISSSLIVFSRVFKEF